MKGRKETIHQSCKSVWVKLKKKKRKEKRENKENNGGKKQNKREKKREEEERKRIWKQTLVRCGEWCRHQNFRRSYQDTRRITMIRTQLGSDFVGILQTDLITRAKCWRTIVKRSRWSGTIVLLVEITRSNDRVTSLIYGGTIRSNSLKLRVYHSVCRNFILYIYL